MALSCGDIRAQIDWLLDGEIDDQQAASVRAHIELCPSCRHAYSTGLEFRQVLRRVGESIRAPNVLRQRVRRVLSHEAQPLLGWRRRIPAAAAALILFSLLWHGGSSTDLQDLEHVTVRHASNLPMDIQVGDWRKVRMYLNHRLPFAVTKPNFSNTMNLDLLGGRVTQVGEQQAAYLRYRLPEGNLSMFVYEDLGGRNLEGDSFGQAAQSASRRVMMRKLRGYTVVRWTDGGLVYSVVSDLPQQHLRGVLTRVLP